MAMKGRHALLLAVIGATVAAGVLASAAGSERVASPGDRARHDLP